MFRLNLQVCSFLEVSLLNGHSPIRHRTEADRTESRRREAIMYVLGQTLSDFCFHCWSEKDFCEILLEVFQGLVLHAEAQSAVCAFQNKTYRTQSLILFAWRKFCCILREKQCARLSCAFKRWSTSRAARIVPGDRCVTIPRIAPVLGVIESTAAVFFFLFSESFE